MELTVIAFALLLLASMGCNVFLVIHLTRRGLGPAPEPVRAVKPAEMPKDERQPAFIATAQTMRRIGEK